MPIWDNQMSIPNTSLTNPMPIQCQSYAITEDIPFSANLLPISKLSANPVPIGQSSAKEWLRIGQGLVLDWPQVDADLVLLRTFRPPSRLGTNPHRGLVPRLSAGMASEMAWNWHWIGWDWHWIC